MQELANRSLERGITIMEIIARDGAVTLAELHRGSNIPKSTIRRLLGTLMARRIVRRSLADAKYRINITMNSGVESPVPKGAGLLVDVAIPILSEHTKNVGWPSDVQIIDGHAMRVIDTTRPLSPFHLYRGVVNRAINIFGSATGQACLAAMPNGRIRAIISQAQGDPRFGLDRFSFNEAAFFDAIEQTRERGYGTRLRQYRGETVVDDKLGAIALPVRHYGEVFGAISLLFPRSLSTTEKMAQLHLDSLRKAAGRISDDLDHYGRRGRLS
jgi:IclR family transcriptional regulator, mhp operon transcriptional activator